MIKYRYLIKPGVHYKAAVFELMTLLNLLLSAKLFVASQHPTIATIDATSIVNEYVRQQAKLSLPAATLKQRVKQFGQQLETSTQKIAQTHHMIIMPQEAVLAGAKDLTQELKDHLALLTATRETLW